VPACLLACLPSLAKTTRPAPPYPGLSAPPGSRPISKGRTVQCYSSLVPLPPPPTPSPAFFSLSLTRRWQSKDFHNSRKGSTATTSDLVNPGSSQGINALSRCTSGGDPLLRGVRGSIEEGGGAGGGGMRGSVEEEGGRRVRGSIEEEGGGRGVWIASSPGRKHPSAERHRGGSIEVHARLGSASRAAASAASPRRSEESSSSMAATPPPPPMQALPPALMAAADQRPPVALADLLGGTENHHLLSEDRPSNFSSSIDPGIHNLLARVREPPDHTSSRHPASGQ
jgi:hypothetical protein